MKRLTAFERGIADIHGRATVREIRAEIVQPAPDGPRRVDRIGLRLTLGALGLFWGLVIAALLIGFVAVVVAALWP